jgi:hypothetical protein
LTKHEAETFHLNGIGFLCRDYDDRQAIQENVKQKILYEMEHQRPREQVIAEIILWARPFACFFERWEFTIEVC